MEVFDNRYSNTIKLADMKRFLYILLAICIGVGLFIVWYIFYWQKSYKENFLQKNISYKSINSQSEAKLYYPEAKIFSPFGQSQHGDETVAFAGAVMTSGDSSEKIYEWYDKWLTTHGWKKDKNIVGGLADTQMSLRSYSKRNKKEIFYVAMNNSELLKKTLGKDIPTNKTVFEFRYIVH